MPLSDTSHLHIKLLSDTAKAPTTSFTEDAGWDLYADEEGAIIGKVRTITTNVAIKIPEGYVGYILPRSSMNAKGVITHVGVLDAGYNGAVKICLTGPKDSYIPFSRNNAIAQLVIQPILKQKDIFIVNELWTSERGSKSFGSSDK